MKKILLFTTLLLLPLSTVSAQNDVQVQIDQLITEIAAKQSELKDLKQSLLDEQATIQFEHEELSFTIQIEVTPYEGTQDYFDDTYIILHVTVENTASAAVPFDPGAFNMYLAEVQQGGVNVIYESMEMQAIPGHTTVEGLRHFNVTEDVSNSEELLVRYQPSDDYTKGETIFEFKVNEYKRINRDEEVVQETTSEQPIQTAQVDKPTTEIETPAPDELSQDEIYSAIEDAYYNDLQNDYYNAPETIYYEEQPEVWEDGPGYEEYWGPSTPQFEGQLSPEEMADLD
ncbi:hypothetical protein ACTQ45_00810 [Fundicoccus sp. Sow4_D5]|uniref:hypothetical protein n=1 Tax=Fundicoccus sp. Sow4_D5 TaxID=3438782 RepID=UPI003F906387